MSYNKKAHVCTQADRYCAVAWSPGSSNNQRETEQPNMKRFSPGTKREVQHVSRIRARTEFLQEHTLYSDGPDSLLRLCVFQCRLGGAAQWKLMEGGRFGPDEALPNP